MDTRTQPDPQTSRALVHGTDLQRRYPDGTRALDGVTLSVHCGESLSITGPSGSGKSTLLALLGLLETPTAGQLLLDGEEAIGRGDRQVTRMRAEHLAFVFQSYHLIQHLDPVENVTRALALRPEHRGRTSNAELIRLAQRTLEDVGLGHRLHSRVSRLSGGAQQRVAVARALACRAPLLLCDEPTGNLDSVSSQKVMDLLLGSVNPASALVIVTHDPQVAAQCDREIRMLDGRIIGEEARDESAE